MNNSILIIDDHPLMRKGLALTLEAESDFTVLSQFSNAEDALDMITGMIPDIVITDLSLPGMNGIEFIKSAISLIPDLKIIVVSRHDETLYAERAIRAGAKGYLMKMEADQAIISAVRRVLAGGIFVSDEINQRLLSGMLSGRQTESTSPLEVLSDRELEVFELTGKGIPTKEIADRLHLSPKTVESYRARIKEKMGLNNATELLQHAVQWSESLSSAY